MTDEEKKEKERVRSREKYHRYMADPVKAARIRERNRTYLRSNKRIAYRIEYRKKLVERFEALGLSSKVNEYLSQEERELMGFSLWGWFAKYRLNRDDYADEYYSILAQVTLARHEGRQIKWGALIRWQCYESRRWGGIRKKWMVRVTPYHQRLGIDA